MREIQNYLKSKKDKTQNNERSLKFLLSCYPAEKGVCSLEQVKQPKPPLEKKFPIKEKSRFHKMQVKNEQFDEIKKHYESERSYEKKINLLDDELERINIIFSKKQHKQVSGNYLRAYQKKNKKKEKIYLEPIILEKGKTARKNIFLSNEKKTYYPETNPNTIYLKGFELS